MGLAVCHLRESADCVMETLTETENKIKTRFHLDICVGDF
jgi:hypothetical protein